MGKRGQKRKNRERRLKREKRKKNRLQKVIKHFTECGEQGLDLAPGGSWAFDSEGMHVEMRCRRCQLKVVRHNEAGQYEIKDIGRIDMDATVLDLLAL